MTFLLALAAIALPGLALASGGLRSGPLRWTLAPLLGTGVWSAAYAATLFAFGADPTVRVAKDAVLALLGLAALMVQSKRGAPRQPPAEAAPGPARFPRALRNALIAAAILFAALFLEHTLRYPDGGWDAWMIWNLRARALARAGGAFRDAFSPEILFWAHQDYPLLLPGAVAQAFLLLGSQPRCVPAAVAFLFAGSTVALLVAALEQVRRPGCGLLAGSALLTTPCFVGFAANQQSDVPIAAFLLGAGSLIALAVETGRHRAFVLAGVCASLAAWTKNEGQLHVVCLAAALIAVPWSSRRDRLRALLRFGLGALPILLLLAWFKLRVAHANDLLGEASFRLLIDVRRWGALVFELVRRVVFFQSWALWLVAEVIALAIIVPRMPARPAARVIGLAAGSALAATSVVYMIQPHELVWFVRASFDRVLIQLWPSILFGTFLVLAEPLASSSRP